MDKEEKKYIWISSEIFEYVLMYMLFNNIPEILNVRLWVDIIQVYSIWSMHFVEGYNARIAHNTFESISQATDSRLGGYPVCLDQRRVGEGSG